MAKAALICSRFEQASAAYSSSIFSVKKVHICGLIFRTSFVNTSFL